MDDRYCDRRARRRLAQPAGTAPVPRVEASGDLVVEVADDGFCGAVVGRRVRARRARGSPRPSPAVPARTRVPRRRGGRRADRAGRPRSRARTRSGRHPDRSPPPTPARASRGRAASSSRAATTPSSSRRCGATTCAPRAWSSSTCRASTCSRPCSTMSRRPPTAATACWSITSCPGRRSPASPTRSVAVRTARTCRIVGHPYVDVWQCVTPRALGIARWPDVPRGIDIKVGRVPRPRLAGARHPADLARAWQRILGRGLDATATSIRRCSAASRSSSTSSRTD